MILFAIPVIAQVPSDLMENCNQWKITYPTGEEDKTLCNEPNNEFFYVNDEGNAIVFRAPIRSDNGTTPNSNNIRSELRERVEDGGSDIYWTTEGTHMIYVKQAITHLPINTSHLVATQIHGNKADGIDDSMVMRLEDSHLFLSFNGGDLRDKVTIKSNYVLGTKHEVIFKIVDGKHYCYYAEDGNLLSAYSNGNASAYLIKDGSNDYVMNLSYDQSYFKIGNYTQSNPDKEGNDTGDPDNYGEVLVYDFTVKHGDEQIIIIDVTGLSLSPSSETISIGTNVQLSASVSPSNASNKNVNYSSNNTSVATVSSSGVVTAVSEGAATITGTTSDGGFTDSTFITVSTPSTGSNIALNKSITGTGTVDGTNIVTNLVDGDVATRWSVSGFPQSATIDLGANFTIGSTELICYSDRDYQYTISISNSKNGTYSQIVDRSSNTTPGTESSPIIDRFTSVDARYVKINVIGAASYTGTWVSLLDFKVFSEERDPNNIAVTNVAISAASPSLKVGETEQLTATVSPSNASNTSVNYSSNNTSIATVSSSGIITAVSVGSATVTVTTVDGSFTDSTSVIVNSTISTDAPYEIVKFQDYLEQCKLQSPLSGTEATASKIMEGYFSSTFYVAENDKMAFYQTRDSNGTSQRTELRFNENWYVNSVNKTLHANVNIIKQTCTQLTFLQIHDDANEGVGNGPNKPLLRVYQMNDNLYAAIKTDVGGETTNHLDLGSTPSGYFDCDISVDSGNMVISVNGSEKINQDISFWTFPSYWKNGVYLQDAGEAITYFNELTLTDAVVSNLALNKSVVVSSQQSVNPGSNLVDGNSDTRWSAQTYTQSVTVDLGATYLISSTEVICHSDRAYQFVIESSTDGNNYSQIVDRSNNSTTGTNDVPISDSFSNTNARYVRISVSGAASYSGDWISLDELRIFGDATSVSSKGISSKGNEVTSEEEISFYPNPASDIVIISGAQNFNTVTVFDQLGSLVMEQALQGESVDISNLKSGMYIFTLIGDTKTIIKRVVKK